MKNKLASILFILPILLISGCNFPGVRQISPTPNVTQAYQTIQAQIATMGPLQTSASQSTVVATFTPQTGNQTIFPSIQPKPSITVLPTNTCDRAAPGNPIDVTIPDDSVLSPGEEFTKTWRLQNNGACTWSRQYALIYFSGDKFTESTVIYLQQEVAPGQSVELSVDMTAPEKVGSYQSNWMLQNPAGIYFGIGPNGKSPFWVRIEIQKDGTPSTTPTNTNSYNLLFSGVVTIPSDNSTDVTTGDIASDNSLDLIYDGSDLLPSTQMQLGSESVSQPDLNYCVNAAMDISSITISTDALYHYYCYQKSNGEVGYLQILNIASKGDLTIEVNTWGQ